ncbi:SH3 domain-containing protein [Maritalea porphyrae]|uniref:SH3 domain-containing protein n=1 Tax=Maritalea porphyrae TaxID=880732 RepID=UPI0022AF0874|nr:SH3 domain-containing protein [Maritalea porphyrae]MCZ4272170.1 SH3 domain-containing protein [Maritalea porphyrae]
MSKIKTTRQSLARHIIVLFLALSTALLAGQPVVLAQSVGASGLPLPRFASLGSSKINVRVGPGQKYEVAWIFVQNGLPIEIVQEFDAWRKVRDSEGAEGWIHKTLLSGRRTALVTPWLDAAVSGTPIYARADATAPRRAILQPKVLVSVDNCADNWCKISGRYKPDASTDKSDNFSGWINQVALWGVYKDEKVK